MNIKSKFIMALAIAIIPLLGNAQSGTTSAGITANSLEYSSTITIGELINTYAASASHSVKSGIIQPTNSVIIDVKETNLIAFEITPNPATDFLQISSSKGDFSEYTIFDSTAKAIRHGNFQDEKISLSGIQPGIYVLKLKSGKEIYSQLFIKI